MALLALGGPGCQRGPGRYEYGFVAMDSSVELVLVCAAKPQADRAARAVQAEVERLESILSDYRPESNLSRLNRRETDVPAPETRLLLQRAQQVCHETAGAFDPSIGPVKRLWGFGTGGTPHVPAPDSIQALLVHVGCDVYALTPDGRLEWRDPAARLDLGGIAQGYVAGCMADTLRGRGITSFLIDVSGDIVAGGRRPDGSPWRIGVQHPRRPDSLLVRLPLHTTAVTTSGDYEQFFIAGGVRYHHIFDPATGYPARGVASVSAFSDDPVAADCFATALFVLGPERGMAFLARRPDLAAIFVEAEPDGRVRMRASPGIEPELSRSAE